PPRHDDDRRGRRPARDDAAGGETGVSAEGAARRRPVRAGRERRPGACRPDRAPDARASRARGGVPPGAAPSSAEVWHRAPRAEGRGPGAGLSVLCYGGRMPAAQDVIVLRYHEIALKGRNRPFFVRRLVEHVARLCADLPVGPVARASARLLLPLRDPAAWPIARQRLGRVFGLANFTLAHEVRLAADARESLTRVGDIVLAHLAGRHVPSFRVATKRSDKRFPLTSPEVNRVLGARIQAATAAPVDLNGAVLTVGLDILPGRAFVSLEKVPGAGGLPVG